MPKRIANKPRSTASPKDTAHSILIQMRNAFQSCPYPGDDNIVYDNSGLHSECNAIRKTFQGKHWSEISVKAMLRENAALCFMTPEAYRFYLPSFLSKSITHYHEMDIARENTIYSLIRPRTKSLRQWYNKRINRFSRDELNAILSSLQYLANNHPNDPPHMIASAIRQIKLLITGKKGRRPSKRHANPLAGK